MTRSIPICERCGWPHTSDEVCFGMLDKDDVETSLDEAMRIAAERGDKLYDKSKDGYLDN